MYIGFFVNLCICGLSEYIYIIRIFIYNVLYDRNSIFIGVYNFEFGMLY